MRERALIQQLIGYMLEGMEFAERVCDPPDLPGWVREADELAKQLREEGY